MAMIANNKGYQVIAQDESIEEETDGKVKVQVRLYSYPAGNKYKVMLVEGRTHRYEEIFDNKNDAMDHYHSPNFTDCVEHYRSKHSQ